EGAVRVLLDGRPVPLTGDGRFLIAFGRDHAPAARLEAQMSDGSTVRADLAVAQRQWQIQRLPGRLAAIEADPAFEERRAAELARVRAARAHADLGLPHWREPFQWPVTGRISGVYGSQRIIGDTPRAPHFGVDIARPIGTPVVAPAGGVVLLASPPTHALEGNLVLLDHGMGLVSSFLHLDRVDVVAGQRVARGEPIGTVGTTGRSTGPHLHWGMTLGDVRIDPARLVPTMPTAAPPPPVASGR
ncbi:MAG: M23 family metallopeptidase, partial [Sphingomonadaceae bacterium]